MSRSTNAFDWKGEASTFSRDAKFRSTADGRSMGQVASTRVAKHVAATGSNPGTIAGLSAKADQQRLIRKVVRK